MTPFPTLSVRILIFPAITKWPRRRRALKPKQKTNEQTCHLATGSGIWCSVVLKIIPYLRHEWHLRFIEYGKRGRFFSIIGSLHVIFLSYLCLAVAPSRGNQCLPEFVLARLLVLDHAFVSPRLNNRVKAFDDVCVCIFSRRHTQTLLVFVCFNGTYAVSDGVCVCLSGSRWRCLTQFVSSAGLEGGVW